MMNRLVKDEGGFALLVTLLTLTVVAAVALVSVMTSSDERLADRAVRESAKAFYAAESGLNAIASAWDSIGADTLLNAPGDSVVVPWQTLENGALYEAVIRRVDGGSEPRLYSIRATGRASGVTSSSRRLALLVSSADAGWPPFGILAGGWMEVGGSSSLVGDCGNSHVNGDYKPGSLAVTGTVSATGFVDGTPVDTLGNPVATSPGADSVGVPVLDPMSFCGDADYLLRSGYVITTATGDSVPADQSVAAQTWNYKAADDQYELKTNDTAQPGKWCSTGNVKLAGNLGSAGSPYSFSMFAAGSIEADGGSILFQPASADGISLMAGGDIVFSGGVSPGWSSPNLTGLVYTLARCELKSGTYLLGQLFCLGFPNPPGALPLASKNKLGGGTSIKYECEGYAGMSPGGGMALISRPWRQVLF